MLVLQQLADAAIFDAKVIISSLDFLVQSFKFFGLEAFELLVCEVKKKRLPLLCLQVRLLLCASGQTRKSNG